MVVQHNIQAMNVNRMLGQTSNAQSKSTEKLSSGYKINRAADDAAGLSISEKMRKQIRGLDQASTNAEDGISAVQTAEGALTEVHDMLQRMNELAVQAANGTNSQSDRKSIQDEVTQLLTEIDRVSETTKFNETYLLRGETSKTAKDFVKAHDAGISEVKFTDYGDGTTKVEIPTLKKDDTITIKGTTYTIGNEATTDATPTADYSDGVLKTNDKVVTAGWAYKKIAEEVLIASDLGVVNDHPEAFSTKEDAKNRADAEVGTTTYDTNLIDFLSDSSSSVTDKTTFYLAQGKNLKQADLEFNLHVGADADMTNKIGVTIEQMSTTNLGIANLTFVAQEDDGSVMTDGDSLSFEMYATAAIDAIADAVAKVSEQRSALGAIQNRLEHTVNNLDNVVENTTSAESRIRDTDMAEEMVNYSKTNILAQAGQSMLSQANQSNQGVLSLLQ